jgi:hypothetical protein
MVNKRKYEDKRDRCFQEHWLEKRDYRKGNKLFTEIVYRSGGPTKNQFLSANPTKPTLFVDRNEVS